MIKKIIIILIIASILLLVFFFGQPAKENLKAIEKEALLTWNWLKEKVFSRIGNWLSSETSKRKEYFKEGIKKEKEEIKDELKVETSKISKSLWDKLGDLIRQKLKFYFNSNQN